MFKGYTVSVSSSIQQKIVNDLNTTQITADEKKAQSRKEKKSANPELRASAAPFVFRAAAASFTPSFVQSKSSVNSATLESSAFAPPSLPAAQPEAAASIQHNADTPPPGMTNSPSKITLTFEKAAALFAAGAAKTKMLYGNPILTLAQKIQLKQLQVA